MPTINIYVDDTTYVQFLKNEPEIKAKIRELIRKETREKC